MRTLILSSLSTLFLCLLAAPSPRPALAVGDGANDKPVWLVVTRPTFLEAIKPLDEKRSKDGFKTVISTRPPAQAIADLKRRPAFLLLIGDDQPGEEKQPWYLPSRTRKLYRWRALQRKEFASDVLWGDLDGDLIPDIPVGRIPVRTARQLELVVNKILTFENKQPTLDDLRLPIWAGSSGYNPVLDSMATWLLLNSVQKNASLWVRPWIISADPTHPLCGWPPDQSATFTKQLERGALMAILMGHASATSFHSMTFNSRNIRYSAEDAGAALAGDKPAPAMVIIACSTGNFTGPENCLGESLLLIPAGPVAVIAATTESHPLTNYFSGLCLLQQSAQKNKRLGSLWLAAQQNAMKARDFIMERMLVNIEGKLEEKMNVGNLRRDQILMYALLGDPATRLYLPDQLHAGIKYSAGAWHWDVRKPEQATRLYVSFRPGGQSFPKVGAQLEKTTARKLFQQANDTFAFKPLREFAAAEAWKGATNKAGTLRLVATGPGRIYAAAFELEPTDSTSLPRQIGSKEN
ncbi:MAG: hypothetical protein KAY65_14185 [Planctomycetes bacterium]|nr:hypothetical protein [Planctomycetota bacterium]